MLVNVTSTISTIINKCIDSNRLPMCLEICKIANILVKPMPCSANAPWHMHGGHPQSKVFHAMPVTRLCMTNIVNI